MRRRFLALVLIAVLAAVVGGCQSKPAASGAGITNADQAKAAVIAWYSDPATHGAGSEARNVVVEDVQDRGSVWRVHLTGDIYGQGEMYPSVMIVDIDPSGKITVVAQG